ncbi:zinc-binding dehydrogenase [Planctomycetales bacterium ZRK34]|nr:zinc-binding dehydrogenase [Planctomycetales bacterium ZRK34]
MRTVIVQQFGGVENLQIVENTAPEPGPGQVVVRMTCIGLNHADLMARRGEYRASSGDPPFTPGIEGGGVIEAIAPDVLDRRPGQRVILPLGARGTYTTHYLIDAHRTVPAPDDPDRFPDDHLGSIWLPYLTAWGCLVWRQNISLSQTVLLPAASSAVALAAAQVASDFGAVPIGLTTSPEKIDALREHYDHVIDATDDDWPKQVKAATGGCGVSVVFDPVAAGDLLTQEIRLLAPHGRVWIYGLLGSIGPVNVQPLIIKRAALAGWLVNEMLDAPSVLQHACQYIIKKVADGTYRLPIAQRFTLDEVQHAHEVMQQGAHLGKMIITP